MTLPQAPYEALVITISIADLRRSYAAFLRRDLARPWCQLLTSENVAANLHNPPPSPPTLAEAYAADLDTPEGKAKVRAFLEFYLNDPTKLVQP